MAKKKHRQSSQSTPTEPEYDGPAFRFGQTGTPGHDGPYPGPWFRLIVQGKVFRGRYMEPHVWVCDSGERLSALENRLMTGGKPPKPNDPSQYGSWYEKPETEPAF